MRGVGPLSQACFWGFSERPVSLWMCMVMGAEQPRTDPLNGAIKSQVKNRSWKREDEITSECYAAVFLGCATLANLKRSS
jgi:hypothetical protein